MFRLILSIIVLANYLTLISTKSVNRYQHSDAESDAKYWTDLSRMSIEDAYRYKSIENRAKNVILFLGDGMGVSTLTPSRILKGQLQNRSGEESKLAFEEFPYVSLIKTYNVDYQVPDSAGTATAFMCGVKTNKAVIGVTARVKYGETNCQVVQQNSISSILKWALDSGKSAGVVTTTRITHATPAGGYASVANRDWEAYMPDEANTDPNGCKDIARQLIENSPGANLSVILGGGSRYFVATTENDTVSGKKGLRRDGQNLIDKWHQLKRDNGLPDESYKFVTTRNGLKAVDYNKVNNLFGLFNGDHMSYDMERVVEPDGEPSLEEMTDAAIQVLKKNTNGFVLLVEGGRIDHSHHDNYGVMALYETVAMDRAVERAVKVSTLNETLIVVTADHSHTFTMNGYPKRGNQITGVAGKDARNVPFTTLMYGNGPGYEQDRTDPSTVDTSKLRYRNLAAVPLSSAHHGGEDVALYSVGPMAHMFHGSQEQSYVAHGMAFAACIGQFTDGQYDHCMMISGGRSVYMTNIFWIIVLLLIFCSKSFL